ncbi:hypothetical protein [Lactiplantibacillus plajomi]|uniref:Uncharacterized protein n=1 Tax=Lactiplantibacillus plajomi TaxID=1457217 RepID=A0ABV6K1H6_9LACO|nr:hypothetical protein [Lactiplantibacillus plajomi]
MQTFIHRHPVSCWLIGGLVLVSLVIGGWFAKTKYDNQVAQRRIERALTANGYHMRVMRRNVQSEASGPFSGISWYQCTFSNPRTLRASVGYQQHRQRPTDRLTISNCPIVYRVVLKPPTAKVRRWTAVIYLDDNQEMTYSERAPYVESLTTKSRRALPLTS